MPKLRILLPVLVLATAATAAGEPDLPLGGFGWIGYGAGAAPVAGGPTCTGVLIAPDRVVTAAHCLTGAGGATMRPADVTFRPGQSSAGSGATVQGQAIAILASPPESPAASIGQDLALLTLAEPVAAVAGQPVALSGAPPRRASAVVIAGYARTAPEAPEITSGCLVQLVEGPLVALDCHAVSGYSGGPVLVRGDDGWLLAGVMVAEARGVAGLGALALWLDPALVAGAGAGAGQ